MTAADLIDSATGVPRQWAGLNRNLIARIAEVDSRAVEIAGQASVFGPITEASFDTTLSWQSPFENTGPEAKLPSMLALIQTGQLGVIVNALQARGFVSEENSLANSVKTAARDLEGRTAVTRLNSRQVMAGVAPTKIALTMHFRAWANPAEEVERPYRRLLEMALPKRLAEDGFLAETIKTSPADGAGLLSAMFPSEAPAFVGFWYGGERYAPYVIEHVSNPIDGPRDSEGLPIYRAVTLELSSLTAIDRTDVPRIFERT